MFWPRLALGTAALAVLLGWAYRDRLRTDKTCCPIPTDLTAWLAVREAGIERERASAIQWAGREGQATDIAVLYLHGFSASPGELRPLPEQVARRLGANLLALRLTGHGLDGAALAGAGAQDWWDDLRQGLAAARMLGRRVVVIGMSTGGTLAALAARDRQLGRQIAATVLIAPNFRLRNIRAWLLDLPFARQAIRMAGDPRRCFMTRNAMHRQRWTTCYPLSATLAVAALLRQARKGDFRAAHVPALFIWSEVDRIVDHSASAKVAARWGGRATVMQVSPGPNDDPDAHVIAGEALSPELTPTLVRAISDWIGGSLS